VSIAKYALRTLSNLGIVAGIAFAFLLGLSGTVYLSLRSPEVKVPDVVGKDMVSGEESLSDAGLNIRKRAARYSPGAQPNTILDQSPRPGEIIKVGQTVAVVVSRAALEGEAQPASQPQSGGSDSVNTNTARQGADAGTSNSNEANRNRNRNANKPRDTNANLPGANTANGSGIQRANSNLPISVNRNGNANVITRGSNINVNRPAINNNLNRRAPVNTAPLVVRPNSNRRIP
jgi:hypothetical protein